MTSVWVAGLVVLAVALGWLVFRVLSQARQLDQSPATDIPLWEAEADAHQQRDFWPELVGTPTDDTAPAVLTPPEWREPKSVSNGVRRPFDH